MPSYSSPYSPCTHSYIFSPSCISSPSHSSHTTYYPECMNNATETEVAYGGKVGDCKNCNQTKGQSYCSYPGWGMYEMPSSQYNDASNYYVSHTPPAYIYYPIYPEGSLSIPPSKYSYYDSPTAISSKPTVTRERCFLKPIGEAITWLTSIIICGVCCALCGAVSCLNDGFYKDEFVASHRDARNKIK